MGTSDGDRRAHALVGGRDVQLCRWAILEAKPDLLRVALWAICGSLCPIRRSRRGDTRLRNRREDARLMGLVKKVEPIMSAYLLVTFGEALEQAKSGEKKLALVDEAAE